MNPSEKTAFSLMFCAVLIGLSPLQYVAGQVLFWSGLIAAPLIIGLYLWPRKDKAMTRKPTENYEFAVMTNSFHYATKPKKMTRKQADEMFARLLNVSDTVVVGMYSEGVFINGWCNWASGNDNVNDGPV